MKNQKLIVSWPTVLTHLWAAGRFTRRRGAPLYIAALVLVTAIMGAFAYSAAEHLSGLYAATHLRSIIDLGNGNFESLSPSVVSALGDYQAATHSSPLLATTYMYIEYGIALCVFSCLVMSLVLMCKGGKTLHTRLFSLPARFRRAMASHNSDELSVHFQPIIDMSSGRWIGAEALLRWSVNGQPVSPASFIPRLEQAGLMPEVTRWICTQVAQAHAHVIWACQDFYITINLSADDIIDPSFPDFVEQMCEDYGIATSRIGFEVTEGVLLDTRSAHPQLARLRQQGHLIALDDFGTGYSSLSYLENLPADIVKLDRAFITKADSRSADTILAHIVSLAHALGLRVIAEGVETQEHVARLAPLNIYAAQGWFYSKDLKAEALARGFFSVAHHPDLERLV